MLYLPDYVALVAANELFAGLPFSGPQYRDHWTCDKTKDFCLLLHMMDAMVQQNPDIFL